MTETSITSVLDHSLTQNVEPVLEEDLLFNLHGVDEDAIIVFLSSLTIIASNHRY